MGDCGARHGCADGRTGACGQGRGHPGRHLCGECLTFFASGTVGVPASGARMAAGSHASALLFQQMEEAARAPRMPPGGPADGPFQLFGVWRAGIPTPYGDLHLELILQPDSRFSQISTMNGLMAYDVGNVELVENFIHFVVTDHEPKEYNGTRIRWLESFGYYYTVVDAHTMELEDRVQQARWIMRRA